MEPPPPSRSTLMKLSGASAVTSTRPGTPTASESLLATTASMSMRYLPYPFAAPSDLLSVFCLASP